MFYIRAVSQPSEEIYYCKKFETDELILNPVQDSGETSWAQLLNAVVGIPSKQENLFLSSFWIILKVRFILNMTFEISRTNENTGKGYRDGDVLRFLYQNKGKQVVRAVI